MKKKILLFVIVCMALSDLAAQRKGHVIAAATAGIMYYQGDLSGGPLPDFRTTHPFLGVEVGYSFRKIFSFSLGYDFGKLSGNDAYVEGHEVRNFNFTTLTHDIRLLTFTDLLDIWYMIRPRKTVGRSDFEPSFTGPCLILGLGYIRSNPKSEKDGTEYQLQKMGTEGQLITGGDYQEPYDLWHINLKYGLGMGYNFSRQVNGQLQFLYCKTFTDYLDDVSGYYPDYAELMNSADGETTAYFTYGGRDGSKVEKGQQRGNPSTEDGFISIGFKLTYTFGRSELSRFMNF